MSSQWRPLISFHPLSCSIWVRRRGRVVQPHFAIVSSISNQTFFWQWTSNLKVSVFLLIEINTGQNLDIGQIHFDPRRDLSVISFWFQSRNIESAFSGFRPRPRFELPLTAVKDLGDLRILNTKWVEMRSNFLQSVGKLLTGASSCERSVQGWETVRGERRTHVIR